MMMVIKVLGLASSPKKLLKVFQKISTFIDAAKFGGFACVFSSAYKFILCLLRRLGFTNDQVNAPIAGFISAWSLKIEVKARKQLMLILVLSRCVDSAINLIEL